MATIHELYLHDDFIRSSQIPVLESDSNWLVNSGDWELGDAYNPVKARVECLAGDSDNFSIQSQKDFTNFVLEFDVQNMEAGIVSGEYWVLRYAMQNDTNFFQFYHSNNTNPSRYIMDKFVNSTPTNLVSVNASHDNRTIEHVKLEYWQSGGVGHHRVYVDGALVASYEDSLALFPTGHFRLHAWHARCMFANVVCYASPQLDEGKTWATAYVDGSQSSSNTVVNEDDISITTGKGCSSTLEGTVINGQSNNTKRVFPKVGVTGYRTLSQFIERMIAYHKPVYVIDVYDTFYGDIVNVGWPTSSNYGKTYAYKLELEEF